MIETRRLKNVVIFVQTILSFVLSRKIINIYNDIARKYGNVTVKKIIIPCLYRSPSQNSEKPESVLTNFERLLSDINALKPAVSVILGDFNARPISCWSNDIGL